MKDTGKKRRKMQQGEQWPEKIGLMFVTVICLFVTVVFITRTGRVPNLDLVLLTVLLSMEIKWRLLYILDMD